MYNQNVSLYAASTYFKTYIILVMKSKYHVQIFMYAYCTSEEDDLLKLSV